MELPRTPQSQFPAPALQPKVMPPESDPARYDLAPQFAFAEPDSGLLLEYWGILKRSKWTILTLAVFGAAAGYLVTLPQTPIYQARTSIEIQSLNENFLNMKEVDPTASSASDSMDAYIRTQMKILQSRSLMERVIDKLDLEKRPDFVQPSGQISARSEERRVGKECISRW